MLRKQLSLYVPDRSAAPIEAVRKIVDPVQSELIPAHVTLCREDEIGDLSLSQLQRRLSDESCNPITLVFGPVEVFSGHGLLLSCLSGHDEFQALREHVLSTREIWTPQPHITLAHPRNPKASGNSLASVASLPDSLTITFDKVCLIEQEEQGPWRVIYSFSLLRDF